MQLIGTSASVRPTVLRTILFRQKFGYSPRTLPGRKTARERPGTDRVREATRALCATMIHELPGGIEKTASRAALVCALPASAPCHKHAEQQSCNAGRGVQALLDILHNGRRDRGGDGRQIRTSKCIKSVNDVFIAFCNGNGVLNFLVPLLASVVFLGVLANGEEATEVAGRWCTSKHCRRKRPKQFLIV